MKRAQGLLTVGLVTLYVLGTALLIYGGVIPEYRTAAGVELSDRVLVETAGTLQTSTTALNPETSHGTVMREVTLPSTINGATYRIRAVDSQLVLEHPQPAISSTQPLVLPTYVETISGSWNSTDPTVIQIHQVAETGRVRIELRNESMDINRERI